MTVDDMLDLVKIGDVAMTPDGSKVFYSERRLNWEKNKYEKTFFMISSHGGEAIPFIRKDGGEQFRISPDGQYLSLLRKVDESPQIFLMPLNGAEPWQWTKHPGEITDYKWSGDRRSVVFVAKENMSEEEAFIKSVENVTGPLSRTISRDGILAVSTPDSRLPPCCRETRLLEGEHIAFD